MDEDNPQVVAEDVQQNQDNEGLQQDSAEERLEPTQDTEQTQDSQQAQDGEQTQGAEPGTTAEMQPADEGIPDSNEEKDIGEEQTQDVGQTQASHEDGEQTQDTEPNKQTADDDQAEEPAAEQSTEAAAVEQTGEAVTEQVASGEAEVDTAQQETARTEPEEEATATRANAGDEQVEQEQGLTEPETDNKGQQTTPAPSRGPPTTHGGETPAQEDQAEAGVQENAREQLDDNIGGADDNEQGQLEEEEAQLVDKQTPVPPTEDMATGTAPTGTAIVQVDQKAAETAPVEPPASSPMPQYDKDATATVKFVLMPTQQVATMRCNLTQSLYELKQHFAQELKIPASTILLMLDGKGTSDRMSLGELGVGPNGTIRLEMQSADPENQPITAFKPRQEYTMPDVISVRVESDGVMKDVVVEIERATRKKPFLGGYRHKTTAVEYHHASAQTMSKPRPPPAVERFCRDTQTVQQKHAPQQTTNDTATQMTKIGVYVSNMPDKLLVPGKYTTADDHKANLLNKVIVIQKYYRRWLARRYVEKVRTDKAECEEWERQEELRKKQEKEERIRREFERRMNPKTKEDFDLLYHALEKWRQEELNKINETLTGAERKAALCTLLDQETQLITSIGRHKIEADSENRDKQIQKFLDMAASAKKWRGPDGKATEMDTPYTIRAQELRDIYNSINMKYLTQDERLDVLLTLKHTVKEHDCKLTQEIIQLIDREADLLMRGVKESNLEGLRKRISTLFLQYVKTPTFNPEAARLLKVPQDPSTLRKNIYFCPSCNQYKPSTDFGLSSNSRAVGRCRKCTKIDNDARVRQDYSHYRYMLKGIRRSEESYGDGSNIAFLMQENDLRYLVENIWNSQSVLSAWDDLYDLVLVRWDQHEEWAPWNSILLTKEEATAHEKLEGLEEAYGKVFVHKVKHKHTLARNYFSRMPGMAEHMRGSSSSAMPNGPQVSGKSLAVTPTQA